MLLRSICCCSHHLTFQLLDLHLEQFGLRLGIVYLLLGLLFHCFSSLCLLLKFCLDPLYCRFPLASLLGGCSYFARCRFKQLFRGPQTVVSCLDFHQLFLQLYHVRFNLLPPFRLVSLRSLCSSNATLRVQLNALSFILRDRYRFLCCGSLLNGCVLCGQCRRLSSSCGLTLSVQLCLKRCYLLS